MTSRCTVRGTISSAAFASGDQFVVGCWTESPVGPIADVMWLDGDGTRRLIASSQPAADFITAIYRFDDVTVTPLEARTVDGTTTVRAPELRIEIDGGRLWPVPLRRPLWVTRRVEAPLARRMMAVETHGVSPTGALEWYQTRGWRWARTASAQVGDRSLGSMVDVTRPMNVGFSNPPRRPSVVDVRVTIELP